MNIFNIFQECNTQPVVVNKFEESSTQHEIANIFNIFQESSTQPKIVNISEESRTQPRL